MLNSDSITEWIATTELHKSNCYVPRAFPSDAEERQIKQIECSCTIHTSKMSTYKFRGHGNRQIHCEEAKSSNKDIDFTFSDTALFKLKVKIKMHNVK